MCRAQLIFVSRLGAMSKAFWSEEAGTSWRDGGQREPHFLKEHDTLSFVSNHVSCIVSLLLRYETQLSSPGFCFFFFVLTSKLSSVKL